ncbi:MAG: hypothetical protein Q4D89_09145 [Arachnia propionica]|uniref:hypothetical protein n=1 Tax=Arachnia propionica TaxID=1750 RepID=UPI0026FC9C78|nr:hypothetical protein [Arachnia propionica]
MTELYVPPGDLGRLAAALHVSVDELGKVDQIVTPSPEAVMPGGEAGRLLRDRCALFEVRVRSIARRLEWMADDIAEADARFQQADVLVEEELRDAGLRPTIPMPGLPPSSLL